MSSPSAQDHRRGSGLGFGHPYAHLVSVAAGLTLVAWIVVELVFLRSLSWLQPFCALWGVLVAGLGWRAHRTAPRRVG